MNNPPDLIIENEYGYICIEYTTAKGIIIYFDAKNVDGMPPNHIKFNEQETMKIAKWLVEWISQNTKIM